MGTIEVGTTGRGSPPYQLRPEDVVAASGSDVDRGLTAAEANRRLATEGPNAITAEKPPSTAAVALAQLRNSMNIMLIAVTIVSFAIGEVSTGIIVALLILLNVVLGARQELKARASVDALSKLQVPQAKVLRDGTLSLVPAVDVVPGDIVALEAGDIVPADGRIVRSATLEAQEAALTGESAPVPKDAGVAHRGEVALGDRTNMLFQNTSVTRGTASIVVTATGMETQMGQIATMLTSVKRTRSPLQKELDSLTKVLGIIAWTAVAFIVVVGLDPRAWTLDELFLLGTAMAISAIPTGLPAFVSGLLSMGAQAARRREGHREEPHRRRDARRDERDQHRQDRHADDEPDDGLGRSTRTGRGSPSRGRATARPARSRRSPASPVPDFTKLALGMVLDSDATVARRRRRRRRPDRGRARRAGGQARRRRRGDPRARTRAWPRCRSTPTTSSWRRSTALTLDGRNGDPAREGRPRRRARTLQRSRAAR